LSISLNKGNSGRIKELYPARIYFPSNGKLVATQATSVIHVKRRVERGEKSIIFFLLASERVLLAGGRNKPKGISF
jgi:hypothetical protein